MDISRWQKKSIHRLTAVYTFSYHSTIRVAVLGPSVDGTWMNRTGGHVPYSSFPFYLVYTASLFEKERKVEKSLSFLLLVCCHIIRRPTGGGDIKRKHGALCSSYKASGHTHTHPHSPYVKIEHALLRLGRKKKTRVSKRLFPAIVFLMWSADERNVVSILTCPFRGHFRPTRLRGTNESVWWQRRFVTSEHVTFLLRNSWKKNVYRLLWPRFPKCMSTCNWNNI